MQMLWFNMNSLRDSLFIILFCAIKFLAKGFYSIYFIKNIIFLLMPDCIKIMTITIPTIIQKLLKEFIKLKALKKLSDFIVFTNN